MNATWLPSGDQAGLEAFGQRLICGLASGQVNFESESTGPC
jgi:hypothetical protein